MPSPRRRAPLFHPRALRERIAGYAFPADIVDRHAKVLRWIDSLRAGKISEAKEVSLHGEFLSGVFGAVLGYRQVAETGADTWDLSAEKSMAGGKSADAAIGFFKAGSPGRVLAPIELKGARQELDHAMGRALTPVQQGWDYANRSPGCRWVIVSNYRETRLYSTARTPDVYESFSLEELEQIDRFKELYFVLARESLLPLSPEGVSLTDELLAASSKVEAEITAELYREYKRLRQDLYVHLGRVHSNIPPLDMIGYTQVILDRILFIAFAEDRGLLPNNTIVDACSHRDKYDPKPLWTNFRAVFRWIDQGSPANQFPAYNGGLFEDRPEVDNLEVSDEMCRSFQSLAKYDYREEISVDVLGHIFEQSITDLEEMRAAAGDGDGGVDRAVDKVSKRRKEGIFYTPAYITRFIVDKTLGRLLEEKFQAIYSAYKPEERKKEKEKEQAWIKVWTEYREAIRKVRVLDPACGSGAFLVAAFDALAREYDRVNAALAALRAGQVELFDLNKAVLNNNLFGVDLNAESVEITKLSLWLKTAQRGKKLTYLDSNIKWGNSIVGDANLDVHAFEWRTGGHARPFLDPPTAPEATEIDARWREGFDVVIGNPPYVRHELLTAIKPYLETTYRSYHGMADLYVYFFERALHELKPGGRLGFIVANKWLRSGYAESLRKMLSSETNVETIVDFGHAPIFPDADTFPCVLTLQKPADGAADEDGTIDVTTFPREQLNQISVPEYVAQHRYGVPQRRLSAGSWGLEPPLLDALHEKIRLRGVALNDLNGLKPYYGIKTGCNEAFIVDSMTKERLVAEDPSSIEILKPFLRGQDIDRWSPIWPGLWMIYVPWEFPVEKHPPVLRHLTAHRTILEGRAEVRAGRFPWYALSRYASDYVPLFSKPKLVYQEIQFHPSYALDLDGFFLTNKGFFLPCDDLWLLTVLNSPLMWWYNWRYLPHMKDETLTPVAAMMETLPIAQPSNKARRAAESIVPRVVELTKACNEARVSAIDSLRMQFGVDKPSQKLENFASLDADAFVKEVLARRPKSLGKLKSSDLKALRELYQEEALPVQERQREVLSLERRLSDLVNEAYGLTSDEIDLMWKTAPPRMPVGR